MTTNNAHAQTKPAHWYAQRYTEKFGFHLVPIEPGRKYPRTKDWGNNTLHDPAAAVEYWTRKPDWNMGIALGPSRMCSLDVDDEAGSRVICEVFGIDYDEFIRKYPTIRGRGLRAMFALPAGVDLKYCKLTWPAEADPTGEKHRAIIEEARAAKLAGDTELEARLRNEAKQYAAFTVFELRCADTEQRQDVLPCSIHPDTGQPYRWATQPPASRDEWPEPPAWLLAIWQNFDTFKPQLKAMCPWAASVAVEKIYKQAPDSRPRYNPEGTGGYMAVVQAYNRAHSLHDALDRYGYTRKGQRWLSPFSGTGLPGVVELDDRRVWIHHASDPLCSEANRQPVSAFDMYVWYDHGGDYVKATRTAANELGMRASAPAARAAPAAETIDHETGEIISAPTAPPHGQPCANVDYISFLPNSGPKGKPYNTIENMHEITQRLGVNIRYNVIKKKTEILIPGKSFSRDNSDEASLAWLVSECAKFEFPISQINGHVLSIADCNQYNPVAEWVNSKPWDGISRLDELFNTVETPGSIELRNALIKRWLIGAVAAAFSPKGIAMRGVLVFQGEQGIGKTHWFKRLAPAWLDVIIDGMLLDPKDKDSIKKCISNWLVELGELDSTFRKADVAHLKAFLTQDSDTIRLPYARRESTFPRRTAFFGSVNPREFLHDPTGNSRFWTVECTRIDHSHDIDMQQVWAEVHALWQAGEGFYLTPDEAALLGNSNADYQSSDPVDDLLGRNYDWDSDRAHWRWATATELLIECGMHNVSKAQTIRAGQFVSAYNGGQRKRTGVSRLILAPLKLQKSI